MLRLFIQKSSNKEANLEGSSGARWRRSLIDEVDRSDEAFEAYLLEANNTTIRVSIPEIGPVRSQVDPIVILTSNGTRDLSDAIRRRCLYHYLEVPGCFQRGRDLAGESARRRVTTDQSGSNFRQYPP